MYIIIYVYICIAVGVVGQTVQLSGYSFQIIVIPFVDFHLYLVVDVSGVVLACMHVCTYLRTYVCTYLPTYVRMWDYEMEWMNVYPLIN